MGKRGQMGFTCAALGEHGSGLSAEGIRLMLPRPHEKMTTAEALKCARGCVRRHGPWLEGTNYLMVVGGATPISAVCVHFWRILAVSVV